MYLDIDRDNSTKLYRYKVRLINFCLDKYIRLFQFYIWIMIFNVCHLNDIDIKVQMVKFFF